MQIRIWAALLAAAAGWGTTGVATRAALDAGVPPVAMVAIRSVIAAALLLAVLQKHGGLAISNEDVFVNVVGGIRISETAADLALVAAILSSYRDHPLRDRTAGVGIGRHGPAQVVQLGDQFLQVVAEILLGSGVKECFGLLEGKDHASGGVERKIAEHCDQDSAAHSRPLSGQRSLDTRIELHGTEVDVLVKLKT